MCGAIASLYCGKRVSLTLLSHSSAYPFCHIAYWSISRIIPNGANRFFLFLWLFYPFKKTILSLGLDTRQGHFTSSYLLISPIFGVHTLP